MVGTWEIAAWVEAAPCQNERRCEESCCGVTAIYRPTRRDTNKAAPGRELEEETEVFS